MVNSKKSIEDIRQIIKKAFDDSKGHNNLIGFISQKNDQERLKRRRGLRSVHSKDELFIEMSHDLSLDQLKISRTNNTKSHSPYKRINEIIKINNK